MSAKDYYAFAMCTIRLIFLWLVLLNYFRFKEEYQCSLGNAIGEFLVSLSKCTQYFSQLPVITWTDKRKH